METPDLLREEYTIDTPENVTFGYEIAGIGSRFIGALIDTTLIVIALLLLNIAVGALLTYFVNENSSSAFDDTVDPGWLAGLVIAIYALINFTLIWGYYMAFELRWNGRTPGKRLAGTQVVKADGSSTGFTESAIRNLVRIIDFMPFAYAIGFVTMFLNRQTRRLGDFAAGTLVIKQRSRVRLEELGAGRSRLAGPATQPDAEIDAILSRFPNIRQLNSSDYQIIQDVLDRHDRGSVTIVMLRRLAVVIAAKVGATAPAGDRSAYRSFLLAVSYAYRVLGDK